MIFAVCIFQILHLSDIHSRLTAPQAYCPRLEGSWICWTFNYTSPHLNSRPRGPEVPCPSLLMEQFKHHLLLKGISKPSCISLGWPCSRTLVVLRWDPTGSSPVTAPCQSLTISSSRLGTTPENNWIPFLSISLALTQNLSRKTKS